MATVQTEPKTRPTGGLDLSAMKGLIRNARWLLRSSWGTTGVGLTSGLLLVVLVTAIVLDLVMPAVLMSVIPVGYLVPLTIAFRVTAAVLIIVPAAYVFCVGVVIPMSRRLRSADVARRIEAQIPGMHNRLVACMDLASGNSPQASPAFYRRLTTEAAAKLEGYRSTRVVDFASVCKALAFALVGIAAFAALWFGFRERLPVAMSRLAAPTADVPPASGVKFVATPAADAKLLRGDPIDFSASVKEGEAQTLTVQLYSETEREPLFGDWLPSRVNPTWPKTRTFDLTADKETGTFRHTLTSSNLGTGFDKSFSFRVFGGGTWTKLQTVSLLERPEIKSVSTALVFPAYLKIAEPKPNPKKDTNDVTGPGGQKSDDKNGQIEVTVETSGNVASGEIQLVKEELRQNKVPESARSTRVWFKDQIPPGSSPAGTWAPGNIGGIATHTEPATPGLHAHAFQFDPKGLKLEPNDVIYAKVYIDPKAVPEAIALQWQDETGSWKDHIAFWGAEKLQTAKISHLPTDRGVRMGAVPRPGQWHTLAVPARGVSLGERATLKGMSFRLIGGQAFWSEAGAATPEYTFETAKVPVLEGGKPVAFPLSKTAENQWTGRFPLRGDGFWRVEVKNERGDANVARKEDKATATLDERPQVRILKPSKVITVSTPQKVPVVVEASDTFGLDEVWLRWKRDETLSDFKSLPTAKVYETVRRVEDVKSVDNVTATLDLEALGLKIGDVIQYEAVARDRLGQTAQSETFTIRIAADANAADKQLEALDKAQDTFRDKLVKLIADQAKVKTDTEKVATKFAETMAKVEAAKLDEQINATKPATPMTEAEKEKAKAEAEKKLPKLDDKTAKELDELRKELAKLAAEEAKNVALGEQMKADLNNLADQAAKNDLVPPEVADEMKNLKDQFDKMALNPLKDLADKFNKGANEKENKPDVQGAKDQSERIQKDLQAMLDKIKAAKEASDATKKGEKDAADKFKDAMDRETAKLTARDLEDLKAAIEALKQELDRMKGAQNNLKDETAKAPDADLPKAGQKQDNLDERIKKALEDAKNALAAEKKTANKKKNRDRPDAPDTGDDPEKTPGREADTENPLPKDPNDKKPGEKDPMTGDKTGEKPGDKEEMPDDDTFDSVIGKKEKQDPRFNDPRKKPKPKNGDKSGDKQDPKDKPSETGKPSSPDEMRNDLKDRQDSNLDNIDKAKQGLENDKSALQDLIDKLKAAGQKGSKPGEPKPDGEDSDPLAEALSKLMNSPEMREAKAMASRMKSQGQGKGKPQPNTPRTSSQQSAREASNPPAVDPKQILGKLDIDTRTTIMAMQPKLRDEVLQGMNGLPPEAYRKHVEDYFRRLTEVQKANGVK